MSKKIFKTISLVLVLALLCQQMVWACPVNYHQLRPLAFAQRNGSADAPSEPVIQAGYKDRHNEIGLVSGGLVSHSGTAADFLKSIGQLLAEKKEAGGVDEPQGALARFLKYLGAYYRREVSEVQKMARDDLRFSLDKLRLARIYPDASKDCEIKTDLTGRRPFYAFFIGFSVIVSLIFGNLVIFSSLPVYKVISGWVVAEIIAGVASDKLTLEEDPSYDDTNNKMYIPLDSNDSRVQLSISVAHELMHYLKGPFLKLITSDLYAETFALWIGLSRLNYNLADFLRYGICNVPGAPLKDAFECGMKLCRDGKINDELLHKAKATALQMARKKVAANAYHAAGPEKLWTYLYACIVAGMLYRVYQRNGDEDEIFKAILALSNDASISLGTAEPIQKRAVRRVVEKVGGIVSRILGNRNKAPSPDNADSRIILQQI